MEDNRKENTSLDYNKEVAAGNAGAIMTEYIAEEKDTLPDIAQKYGVSIEEIIAANKEIINSKEDMIQPGLKLMIPNKRS